MPTRHGGAGVTELVIADLRERERLGVVKYGMTLQAFNGRDAIIDLYQELLDGAQYVRQYIEERERGIGGWVDREIAKHEGMLRILKLCPWYQIIRCLVCDGADQEHGQCGCGGLRSVKESIEYVESQLEILSK